MLDEEFPETVEERKAFLKRNHIALWDVLASCEIKGASDVSIRNAEPNDMNRILKAADIRAIFATGAKAAELYKKLCLPACGVEAIRRRLRVLPTAGARMRSCGRRTARFVIM